MKSNNHVLIHSIIIISILVRLSRIANALHQFNEKNYEEFMQGRLVSAELKSKAEI